MRRVPVIMGVAIVAAVSAACSAPLRGQIVEAEAGRPIEGVVILAYWLGSGGTWVTSHGSATYRGAEQIVTGPDGSFVIPAQSSFWGKPQLVIFKPGYGQWQFQGVPGFKHLQRYDDASWTPTVVRHQQKVDEAWKRFSGDGVVIELPRLTTKQQRLEMLWNVNWAPVVPLDKTTRLDELIKQERAYLGLR